MADDQRERHPLRDQGDNPAEDGTRSDYAGTAAAPGGVAPGGDAVERADGRLESHTAGASSGETERANPLEDVEHPTPDQ